MQAGFLSYDQHCYTNSITILLLTLLLHACGGAPCVTLLRVQGMNFVAGVLLLVLTRCGRDAAEESQQQLQQQQLSAKSSGGLGYNSIEADALGCLLGYAEDLLPGYWSPAMMAPQVGALEIQFNSFWNL